MHGTGDLFTGKSTWPCGIHDGIFFPVSRTRAVARTHRCFTRYSIVVVRKSLGHSNAAARSANVKIPWAWRPATGAVAAVDGCPQNPRGCGAGTCHCIILRATNGCLRIPPAPIGPYTTTAMARPLSQLLQLLLCAAALRPAAIAVHGQDADSLASSFFSGNPPRRPYNLVAK